MSSVSSSRYVLNAGQHPALGKAWTLRDKYNAVPLFTPLPFDEVAHDKRLVCVIDNGAWEAAMVISEQNDYDRVWFDRSGRAKLWLLIDREIAERLLTEGPWL